MKLELIILPLVHLSVGQMCLAYLYSNTPGGKALIFSNQDDGLAWPINKATDLSNAVWHGLHCVTQLRGVAEPSAVPSNVRPDNERHHIDHCREEVQKAIRFFETNPDYSVHPIICNDLKELFELYTHISVLPIGLPIDYQGESVADDDGRIARQAFVKYFKTYPEFVSNDEVFYALASINSGSVKIKAMNNYTLTPMETKHLQQWESSRTNRLSALGLFCILGDGKSAPLRELAAIMNRPLFKRLQHPLQKRQMQNPAPILNSLPPADNSSIKESVEQPRSDAT